MTAEKVHAGIAVALKQFAERGWQSDVCFIRPDETAGRVPRATIVFSSGLVSACLLGALRYSKLSSTLFARLPPGAASAFNTRPDDSADARARVGASKPNREVRRLNKTKSGPSCGPSGAGREPRSGQRPVRVAQPLLGPLRRGTLRSSRRVATNVNPLVTGD